MGFAQATSVPRSVAMKYMQQKGFRVIPVNPGVAGQEILGETVMASLNEIDEPIEVRAMLCFE